MAYLSGFQIQSRIAREKYKEATKGRTEEERKAYDEKEQKRKERNKAWFASQKERAEQDLEKDLKWFYGEDVKPYRTSKGIEGIESFHHVIDNDNIIIVTSNVKTLGNEKTVLVVDNNKAVFLKEWQARPIKNWELRKDAYAVKLNRKYFKAYTFKSEFNEFLFNSEDTFDTLVECAKEQDENQTAWKFGHYGF